jgi:hypothetical protein
MPQVARRSKGQRDTMATRAALKLRRIVAMEFGTFSGDKSREL